MKIYNTLTTSVENLSPLNPPSVTIYTCGPTVYDYAHVGHWFTYIRWDTLIRILNLSGLETKWVMNITDVGHLVSDADEGEDKLEKGARREGKSAWEVAEFYTHDFLHGMTTLNITKPDYMPKATDHIKEQIELIQQLERKSYAYVIDDGVYYDTSKFADYAHFARLDLDDLQAGARVEYNPQKHHISDFALWKFSPIGSTRDMEWDSPWGKGFPGWHIECSAIAMKYLGETLDIHTGGIDHIPIHHTNEIAQSEAVTGERFANYWMHANHVTINGEKISKSLNNGIRLQEIEARGISLEAFRLHVLESHYRSQSKFSWDSLEAAQNRLKRFRNFAVRRYQIGQPVANSADTKAIDQLDIFPLLTNDLDTPAALVAIEEYIDAVEKHDSVDAHAQIEPFLKQFDAAFGLHLLEEPDIQGEQKQLIKEREHVRDQKQWQKSDELRDELVSQGIGLRDTETGTIWYRL